MKTIFHVLMRYAVKDKTTNKITHNTLTVEDYDELDFGDEYSNRHGVNSNIIYQAPHNYVMNIFTDQNDGGLIMTPL